MEPMDVMAMWLGDPLAGQLVFGSGVLLICALVAAIVGTMLAALREKSAGSSPARHATIDVRTAPRQSTHRPRPPLARVTGCPLGCPHAEHT